LLKSIYYLDFLFEGAILHAASEEGDQLFRADPLFLLHIFSVLSLYYVAVDGKLCIVPNVDGIVED
jgi:hypothetical protein